jgi:CelD/BcsL family acetyltransferase involved in cellulose biosynthesis
MREGILGRVATITLSPGAVGAAEVAAWRELCDEAVEPNPFYAPEFVLPAWSALGVRGGGLRVVLEAGEWIACLPVQGRRAAPAATVGLAHAYSFLSTPLIRRGHLDPGARGLIAPRRRAPAAGFCLLRAGGGGPVDRVLAQASVEAGLAPVWERRVHRAAAHALGDAEAPRHRNLERQRRRMEKALGAEVALEDRSGSAAAVQQFLDLEAAGWKGRDGTAIASRPGDRAFFESMTSALAARGQLRLWTLTCAGRTTAMACELRAGDAVFGFKTCHDEELRRFSPGTQLLGELLHRFWSDPRLSLTDSCSDPDAEGTNNLYGGSREILSLAAAPRPAAAALRVGIEGLSSLRRAVVSRRA